VLSLVEQKCVRIIKMPAIVMEMVHHSKFPNLVCAIDEEHQCRFINVLNEEVVYTHPDKIHRMRFSPSGNKFIAVLTNGNIREYAQNVKITSVDGDDAKESGNSNSNSNSNSSSSGKSKQFVMTALNSYKAEDKGSSVSDIQYRTEEIVIFGNDDGEFKMVNMATASFMTQWKVQGPIERGSVCKFDVKGDCVVHGNGAHQLQVYDVEKEKTIRRVDTGKGRKMPFSFATFCLNHPQSVMMVSDNIVFKFDPLELVQDYFPSTVDFAIQHRKGVQCFHDYHVVRYAADQVKQ